MYVLQDINKLLLFIVDQSEIWVKAAQGIELCAGS